VRGGSAVTRTTGNEHERKRDKRAHGKNLVGAGG